jgi:hypothetical protein
MCLLEHLALAEGSTLLGGPPTGTKWVVREIHSLGPGPWYAAIGGWSLTDSENVEIAAVRPPVAVGGWPFEWAGRQVIEEGDTITVNTAEPGWQLRVSGYQLTLP